MCRSCGFTLSALRTITLPAAGHINAAKKAEDYLNSMAFSRSGLIEQLEYEGFTHEQAVYGAEQNGH